METPPSSPGGTGRQWPILLPLALSMLLASLGTSIANIALPALSRAFAAPFHHVQWVVIAYLASLTLLVVFAGRLGDILGLRRMHLAGLALFAVASLLCGAAPTLAALIAARALQGVGAAFVMTLSIALIRQTAREGRMGQAMGLLGTASAIGTALGPALGGVLIAVAGWRGIFLVQAPVALATLVLTWTGLRRGGVGATSPGPAFATVRRGGRYLRHLLTNFLVAAVMMTTLVVGPFYLGLGLGLGDIPIGLVMSIGPVVSILTGVPSGRAVDRWGARRVLGIGLAMLAAGAFTLSLLPGVFGVGGYVAAIAILTPGYQLFQAANNTAVMTEVAKERRGLISGLLNLSRNLGLIAGASAMGAVFALGAGTTDFDHASAVAIADGMRLTFMLAGGLMIAALWVAFARSIRTGAA